MKFIKAEAFEKHINEALPNHPSAIYALIIKDSFERSFVLDQLLEKLEGEASRYQEVSKFLDELESLSLLAQKRILILENAEKLPKVTFPDCLKNIPAGTHVVLCGQSLAFYEVLKNELVMLDLSSEKPWERMNRLKRWIFLAAQKQGKHLSADAAAWLAEYCQSQFESVIREIEKIITFVGENPLIELEDVQAVTSLQQEVNGWKLAEAVVWGGEASLRGFWDSDPEVNLFLGQLRYQLGLGLVVASCLARGEEREIQEEYPKLPAKGLDKYKQMAKTLEASYFKESLKDLFELELNIRKKTGSSSFFLDTFVATLRKRRSHG